MVGLRRQYSRGEYLSVLKSAFILILAKIKGVELKFGLSFFIFSSLLIDCPTLLSLNLSLSLHWRHSACECVCFFCLTLTRSKFGIWIRPCIVRLHYKWLVSHLWCVVAQDKGRRICTRPKRETFHFLFYSSWTLLKLNNDGRKQ